MFHHLSREEFQLKWNAATLKQLFKPPGTLNWDEFQHHMQNPAVKVGVFWGCVEFWCEPIQNLWENDPT